MKKKHPEHVNLERWLVSYADFMTLLFALFVVMYATAQANQSKLKAVAQSIRKAFDTAGPAGMMDIGGMAGGRTANVFEETDPAAGRILNLPAGKTNTASEKDPQLQEMRELLEESMSLEMGATEITDTLKMEFDSRGLIVRITTKDFFERGEASVQADLRPILDRIGKVLMQTKRIFRIEGHTEKNEYVGTSFSSDWELSSARSAWIAKYWMNRFDLDPTRIGVAGYSHYHPLTHKSQSWDQGKNRRVELIILNNQYSQP